MSAMDAAVVVGVGMVALAFGLLAGISWGLHFLVYREE